MQPRCKGTLAAERVQPFPHSHEDVLHELARGGSIADEAETECVNARCMRVVEGSEGGVVSVLRGQDRRIDQDLGSWRYREGEGCRD